jgi:hypothetical protein
MRERKTSIRSRREILTFGAIGAVVGAAALHRTSKAHVHPGRELSQSVV